MKRKEDHTRYIGIIQNTYLSYSFICLSLGATCSLINFLRAIINCLCSCGRVQQMAKHIFNFCPRHARAWHKLRDEQGYLSNFLRLLGTAERQQMITKWVMQRGFLGHFRGPGTRSMALPFPSPQLKANLGITLRYWWL